MIQRPAPALPAALPAPACPRRRATLVVLLGSLLIGAARAQGGAPPALELNRASQAELEQLPGLGPALSEQLLAERQARGGFRDWRDLVARIKGVGPAKARRWSDAGLRVGGLPYPAESSALR